MAITRLNNNSITSITALPSAVDTGSNTPAFLAYLSSNVGIGSGAHQLVPCDTEVFDTDNCYTNSGTYRFTPNVAGKYFVYAQMRSNESADFTSFAMEIYRNGTKYNNTNASHWHFESPYAGYVIDFNGSTDYVDLRCYQDSGSNKTISGSSTERLVFFGAYKLII